MRTTLSTIFSQTQANLNRISADIIKINSQISSGLKMSKLSDDPTSLVAALGMRSTIAEISQYQENLNHGSAMIAAAESALRQIKDQVMEAKTLAISAQTPVMEPNRALIAPQVANFLDQAVTLANTQIGGKYIFGGYRTSGYTQAEPSPFIQDQINGYRLNGIAPAASAPLAADELKINGTWVPAAVADTVSTVDPTASATAKAAAINSVSAQTGVTAEITPARITATAPVTAGTLDSGDLIINGVDIFAAPTVVTGQDSDNTIIEAINAQIATTGVYASRDSSGTLLLKAVDGRNIETTTTGDGETVTHLNGAAGTEATYGRLELLSNRTFMLESALVDLGGGVFAEPGLEALGLSGGAAVSGEPTDLADDGKLSALSIADLEGNVRYAGDREGSLEIKVGKVEKMSISQNGQTALIDTDVFAAIKDLENTLLGKNFTEVTSLRAVTDMNATFASGTTGLPAEPTEYVVTDGSFTINVVDHDHLPPETFAAIIPVITTDTPADIAAKINNIPGLNASWNSDGHLEISSDEPDRYTFSTAADTSNFTRAAGITQADIQVHAINKSIGDLDQVMEKLTTHISDFGARGNRIDVQSQIFTNLDLAVQQNLSDKQDTDLIKAIMDLQAAEHAYQASLAAASRTMTMSLLDYL